MFTHAFRTWMVVAYFVMLAPALLPHAGPADAAAQLLPPSDDLDKLDPVLRAAISDVTGESPVIVRVADGAAIGPVSALVQQLGGTSGRELAILNALAATMPHASIPLLAADGTVERIVLDRPTFGSLDRTAATVGSAAVRADSGYDGHGIGIAVVDSGVAASHDDLGGATGGTPRIRQFVDFVAGVSTPYDDYGHGSHVAGIIAGNGFDSDGARTGLAPAAHLVVLKVLDQYGRGRISDVIAALDYVAAHKDTFALRVVNLSIGAAVHESYDSDLLTLAAKRLVEQGVVVVAAAGNAGRTADGKIVYGGIAAPGNAPWVLTVGASTHMGTADRADDAIAQFSSRGPTVVDRLAKPDVVAPGVGIVSLIDGSSWLYHARPQSRIRGTVETPEFPYLSLSGTSQATPVVSATVAQMLQANPQLAPNAIKAILEYTATNSPAHDPLTQGAGFVNARGAVVLAEFFAQPSTPFPDPSGWSRHIIWGNHRITLDRLMPDAPAWSASVMWGDEAHTDDAAATGDVTGTQNVVWGNTCNGDDCSTSTWSTSYDDDTVVWGNSSDDDTVVWGNSSDDDTVVWGNSSDDDTVVWGNSCTIAECEQ